MAQGHVARTAGWCIALLAILSSSAVAGGWKDGVKILKDRAGSRPSSLVEQSKVFAGEVRKAVQSGRIVRARERAQQHVESLRDFADREIAAINRLEKQFVDLLTKKQAPLHQIRAIQDAAAEARREINRTLPGAIARVRAALSG